MKPQLSHYLEGSIFYEVVGFQLKIYTDVHFSKRLGIKTPNMVHFTIIIAKYFLTDGAFLISYGIPQQQQLESFKIPILIFLSSMLL